jgi:outer membrane receptor for ferrienterochelin and colicins
MRPFEDRAGKLPAAVLTVLLLVASFAGSPVPADAEATVEAQAGPTTEHVTAPATNRALQEDSGVVVQTLCTNCNNADLSVGGLGNDHVSVLCDGMLVPPGLAQVYLLSVMPATMIDKVVVKKGAGEAELDGSSVGGAIEIERRRPEPEIVLNATGDAGSYGWRGVRSDLSGVAGIFGGSLAASWAQSDSIDPNQDGFAELPTFDRMTAEAIGEFDISPTHNLKLGASIYEEDQEDGRGAPYFTLDNQWEGWEREDVQLGRRQVDLSYGFEPRSGSNLQFTAFRSDRSQDIQETQTQSFPLVDLYNVVQLETYAIEESHDHARAAFTQPVGHGATVRVGVSATKGRYEVLDVLNNLLTGRPGHVFEERLTERGAWAEGETSLGGKVDLALGLRYVDITYSDNEDRSFWASLPLPEGDRFLPRASLTYKPTDAFNLRFSAGTGFRAPQPTYGEVCCGRRYRNSRGLRTETSEAYGFELTYQPDPRYKVAASYFLTKFDDLLIRLAPWSDTRLRRTYQSVNVTKARYNSVNMEVRFELSRYWTIKGAGSWLDAANRSEDDVIVALVDYGSDDAGQDVVLHTKTIPFLAEWRGSIGTDFTSGSGLVKVGVSAAYTGSLLTQRFVKNQAEPEEFVKTADFRVVNFRASKAFRNGVTIFAGVDNIFDHVQDDIGNPQFDYNWGPLRGIYYYAGISYSM